MTEFRGPVTEKEKISFLVFPHQQKADFIAVQRYILNDCASDQWSSLAFIYAVIGYGRRATIEQLWSSE